MIGNVVGRRGRENNLRSGPANRLGDSAAGIVVVEDGQVAEFQTDVDGPDQRRGRASFLAADRGDRFGIMLGTPAIAGGHRGDRHVAAELAQQGERAGTLKFHVVGVSM